MWTIVDTWDGANGETELMIRGDGYRFADAIAHAAWLMERPTARILPGYTVTVVEVGV